MRAAKSSRRQIVRFSVALVTVFAASAAVLPAAASAVQAPNLNMEVHASGTNANDISDGDLTNQTGDYVAYYSSDGTEYLNWFECSLDGAQWEECGGDPSQYSSSLDLGSLDEGSHSFGVRENYGNGDISDEAYISWTIDTTAPAPPTVTLDSPSLDRSGATNRTSASVSFSGDGDAGSTLSCSDDGSTWSDCVLNPLELSNLPGGTYSIYVKETDAAGNESDPGSVTWTVNQLGVATDPTLDTGDGEVSKPNVIKGQGYALFGVAGTDPEPTPVFEWQRCSAKDDASSCQKILGSGADGAWWGTRDADIGQQVRLTMGWDTVQGFLNTASPLSGLIGPSGITSATLSTASPKVGVPVHSSFGEFAGWISGVSTTNTTWYVCPELDLMSCVVSDYDPSNWGETGGQWYTPGLNDVGNYLIAVRTITTYGMSTSVESFSAGYPDTWSKVASAGVSSRRARAAVRPRARKAVRKPARSNRHHRARAGRRLSAHAARR